MLKTQYPTDYLKEFKSQATEPQGEQQYTEQYYRSLERVKPAEHAHESSSESLNYEDQNYIKEASKGLKRSIDDVLSGEELTLNQKNKHKRFKRSNDYQFSSPKLDWDKNIWQITVPRNNNCLFISIALAYLVHVKDNDAEFKDRFEKLFPYNNLDRVSAVEASLRDYNDKLQYVSNLISNYNPFSSAQDIYNDAILNELIKQFRNRVGIDDSNVWGTDTQIETISRILRCKVRIFSETNYHDISADKTDLRIPELKLFHDATVASGSRDGNYYKFYLEKDTGDRLRSKVMLKQFVGYFVEGFEAKLNAYYMVLEGKASKAGKISDTFAELLGGAVGGSLGGTIGFFLGSPAPGARVGASVGGKLASLLGREIGEKHHKERVVKLLDLVYYSKESKAELRKILVEAGFDIFQSFEMQFIRATAESGNNREALRKLAEDATNRAISYYEKEKEGISITEAVILGKSKIESVLGIPIRSSRVRSPGFRINYQYQSFKEEWVTSSLYEKVGLVKKEDRESASYYQKKDSTSRTAKYGYRRLFISEDWSDLDKRYKPDNIVRPFTEESKKKQLEEFRSYQYILNPKNLEQESNDILEKINLDDKDLGEERIKAILNEVKDNIIAELNVLKGHQELNRLDGDRNVLNSLKSELSELNIDEYLKEFKRYFEEAKQERQKIAKAVERGREENREGFQDASKERQEIAGGNKKEHEKTREVIIHEIKNLAQKDQDKEPIRFEVKDSALSFTGRQEQLDQVAASIQQGIVVISGLGGVGKSELAIKYAHNQYSQQDSVIWVNAETRETAKASFRRLLKVLELKTIDTDGDEKSIELMAEEAYNYFTSKTSLFIFDNAQKYTDIKKFLPLRLHPGANEHKILITSNNLQKSEWDSSRAEVKIVELGKFKESESKEFIKKFLKIRDGLQDADIETLAKKLYHFPLLLKCAVKGIKGEKEGFKVSDYINKYIESFPHGSTSYHDIITKLLKVILDKIRQEEHGQKALQVAYIIAYCASHLPEGIFSDQDVAISLLLQHSIVEQGSINMHELIQQIIRSELQNQQLEKETLKQALNLFKDHMKESDSVEQYEPHIISVWKYASEYGELIDNFITNADYNESDYTTYLHLIVENSSDEVVGKILNRINTISPGKLGQIINVKRKDQKTLLHCAALGGNEQTIRLLVEKGATVDAETQQKFTPLHLAAKENHLSVVNALLDKEANINAQTKQKFTPLHFAAKNGYLDVVNALLDKGAKVENFDVEYKITPLHLAAKNDNVEVIKALLGKGKADINAKTPKKTTPLMYAAREGKVNAVTTLLTLGADITLKNDESETALNLAAKGDHWETALALFNKGAKLDNLNPDQYLSFCFHLSKNKFKTEYRKLYSDKRKNLYLKALSKIEDSIQKGDIDKFKKLAKLINQIGEIEKKDEHGNVFLPESFYQDNSNSIKDTNLIILACEYNNLEVLKDLFDRPNEILSSLSTDIKKDISPDGVDGKGHNAFYYAIRSGNVELLDTLINKWPDDYFATHSKKLDDILARAYDELKLKNVPLSEEIEVFVQDKLINLRFFYEKDGSQSADKNQPTLEDIKKRIDIVIGGINSLEQEYSDTKEVDGKFLYISTFIGKNIRILKRQLPFTYDKLPWEEIEFSLTSFISSYTKDQEINFVFKTILNKQKLLDYLSTFKDVLSEQKNILKDKDLNRGLPNIQRRNIVDNIIDSNPTFSQLYDDHEQMRDIYSLKQIEHYVNLVLSDNIEEEIKQHVIERALQVTGEYLKSTLTSPNMSSTLSGLIIQSVSEDTSKILTGLRNSLSHSYSLANRMEITKDPEFLSNVQNDLKKIGEKIIDIFYKNKVKMIRTLLERIANSNSLDEIKEIAKVLEDMQCDKMNLEEIKIKEHESIKKLIEDLDDQIKDKTDYQKELFKKINDIFELEKSKLTNVKFEHFSQFLVLKDVVRIIDSINIGIKTIKTLAQSALRKSVEKDKDDKDKQEKIADLVIKIAGSIEMGDDSINKLVYDIFYTVQFVLGKTSSIEKFNDKLERKRDKDARRTTTEERQAKLNNILDKILREELHWEEGERVRLIEELESKGMEEQGRFSDTKEKLLSILYEFVNEESKGEQEIRSEVNRKYEEGGYESLINGSGLEVKEQNMLKSYLTKTKKLSNLIKRKEDIKDLCDKITDTDIKPKIKEIFDELMAKVEGNRKKIEEKAQEEEAKSKFERLIKDLELEESDQEPIKRDYQNNNLNDGRKKVEGLISNYEKLLGLIDYTNKEGISRISQLFNRFSQLLNLEGGKKEKLNKSFKEEIEEILKSNSIVNQRLSTLEDILNIENFPSYEENQKLQAAVEMLVLDITEVLNAKGLLTENKYFLDKPSSILIGKQLRNYLAHGDFLIDALSFYPFMSIVSNAKTFVEEKDIITRGEKLIGQPIANDPSGLAEQHKQNLDILNIQKEMFSTAEGSDFKEVKNWIKKGADINARDINGWSVLHYAARGDNLKVIKLLLDQNISIDTKSNKGEKPLHIAARFGSEKIIESSDFVKYKDPDINYLLFIAAENGRKKVIEVLYSKGADINVKGGTTGWASLHFAARNGHKDVVDALLKIGDIDVDAQTTNTGLTPLHLAAQNGCEAIVETLLSNGANVNAQTTDQGWTPLHFAATSGYKEIVDVLLKRDDIDVSAEDNKKITPLYLTALIGHKEIVEALLSNDANVKITTDDGVTPLHVAAKNGHKEVVEALLKIDDIDVNAQTTNTGWTPLHLAAQNGHLEVIDTLLKVKDIDVNAEDKNKWTPLHLAAQSGHNDVVKALLSREAKTNAADEDKWTPLHYAAQNGHNDVVLALLKVNDIDVNANTNKGVTALHFAALYGHKDVVWALLKVDGIKINAQTTATGNGATPLHLAAESGYKEVVKALLSNGANVNAKTTDKGWAPLHFAALDGSKDVVEALLSNGANVNAKTTDDGVTPLHFAAENGHKDVVDALLKIGDIDVNAQTTNTGWTPLHLAAQNGHLEVIDTLLKVKDIDVNAEDKNKWTPLHLAAQSGHNDVVKALLSREAKTNAADEDKWTPLHYAAQNGHNDVVLALLKVNDIDVNANTNKGVTALHFAALYGHKDVVWALLKVDGIKINAQTTATGNGATPLHLAAESGYKEVVKALLSNGANVNAKTTDKGWTPLHLAAKTKNGNKDVVEALLNNGANVNAEDNDKFTPLCFAVLRGNENVVVALLNNGADVLKKTTIL